MSVTAARRLGLVEAAERQEISNAEAAVRAGLSLRQFKRLRQRYRERGPAALVHGNRGRVSKRRLGPKIQERIVGLLRNGKTALNDCHIRDLLAEGGVNVSAEAVRQVRRRLGLPPKHRRRPVHYYARREPVARAGALVLIDGSPYHWFGRDRAPCSLVGTIDDATGVPLSGSFRPEEDLQGFTIALRDVIRRHGVPEALYGDRTNIAVRSDKHWSLEEELEGRQRPTQFGRMLEELGVRYIAAGSPEAKGRIERLWRTFQDRLTAEFALHGIATPEAAQAYLPRFYARYRRWFGRAARESTPAWRPAPADLDRILACRYERIVARDNTVSIERRIIQIPPRIPARSFYRSRVEVRELLDGRALVLLGDELLAEQRAPDSFVLISRNGGIKRHTPARTTPRRIPSPHVESRPQGSRTSHTARPAKNHPWRKGYNPILLAAKSGA